MGRFFAVALLLCLCAACASNPKPNVTPSKPKEDTFWLKVTPAQSFEPAYIRITIHVPRAPENRQLDWTCDSGDGDGTLSSWQLEGENAQQTFVFERKSMGAGEYECRAGVARQGLPPIYATPAKFTVIGKG